MGQSSLYVFAVLTRKQDELELKCDGCGAKLALGAKAVSGINSCCGACERTLCEACVLRAAVLIGLIVQEEKTT